MKTTVRIDGADTGLIERLAAAANRKLAPKLKRLAARHIRSSVAAQPRTSASARPRLAGLASGNPGSASPGAAYAASGDAGLPDGSAGDSVDTQTAIDLPAASTAEGTTLFDVSSDLETQ